MKWDVAFVEDGGHVWVVSSVITADIMSLDFGKQYIRLSSEASKDIKAALDAGMLVVVNKNLGREICIGDYEIREVDNLTAKKQIAKSKVRNYLDHSLESMSIVDIYAYTAIFSKFASRGIFITDENLEKVKELYTVSPEMLKDRDDAYVDIIMKNSEDDLQDLQELVDSQDKMKRIYDIYKRVKNTIQAIDDCKTEEEVDEVRDNFFHEITFPGE